MSLKLYFHPLSSFCWKALIALYENDTPFEPQIVDLGNEAESAAFRKVWPIRKFPVLRDEAKGQTIPESSAIIEYLALHHPGAVQLVPADSNAAFQVRQQDRFYDFHVHLPMQKIVTDKLRPPGGSDVHGVADAKAQLTTALGLVDRDMAAKTWSTGDTFTMADCSAAPPLFYADKIMPFRDSHRHAAAYLDRLKQRPSIARVIEEAQPYMKFFPG